MAYRISCQDCGNRQTPEKNSRRLHVSPPFTRVCRVRRSVTSVSSFLDTNNIEISKCTTDECQELIECNLIPFQPPRLFFLFAQVAQWTGLV